jgi:DNA replication licensing factor MCM2
MSEIHLGACNSCQSKGPFYIDKERTIYRNHQTITVQELPHEVPPGRIPRQKDVVLLGDNIELARPGDAVQIIGVYMNRYSLNLNIKQGFPVFNTIIEANSIIRIEDSDSKDDNEKDGEDHFKQLSKRPNLEQDIINSIAPSIYGH